MLCGGNIDTAVLGRCLERGMAADGRLVRFAVCVEDRPGGVAALTKVLYECSVRYVKQTAVHCCHGNWGCGKRVLGMPYNSHLCLQCEGYFP